MSSKSVRRAQYVSRTLASGELMIRRANLYCKIYWLTLLFLALALGAAASGVVDEEYLYLIFYSFAASLCVALIAVLSPLMRRLLLLTEVLTPLYLDGEQSTPIPAKPLAPLRDCRPHAFVSAISAMQALVILAGSGRV